MKTKASVLAHALFRVWGNWVCCAAWMTVATDGLAINPPHLSEMPAVERVNAEIKGSDAMDTAARKAGAFFQLRQIIYDLALSQRRDRNEVTPDEKRLADGYYVAAYYAGQPIEKSLSEQDKPKWVKLQGRYSIDPAFREQLFKQLFSASFRTAYFKATGEMDARVQKRQDDEQKAFKEAQAQGELQAKQRAMEGQEERAVARCVASGRPEIECIAETMGKGLSELGGIINPSLKKTVPHGLRLNGAFAGNGGLSIGFHSSFASVDCSDGRRDDLYTIEMKGNQLVVTIQNEPKPYALTLTPAGHLAGSGTIAVKGKVRTGTRHYTDGTTTPLYGVETRTCTLGLMPSTGQPAAIEVAEVLGGLGSSATKTPRPLGLRMNGTYAGQGGFSIEFNADTAVVGCAEVAVAHPYTVEKRDNQVVVQIKDAARPFLLDLRPDGQLVGSGPIQVNGRVVVGVTSDSSKPVAYQPRTASCNIGILTPTQEPPSAAAAGAAAARQAYIPSASAKPNTPPTPAKSNSASSPTTVSSTTGTAVLSVTTGFATQPGVSNPLAGQPAFLLKESFDTILTKGGFQPNPGTSSLQGWAAACSAGQPICGQAMDRIGPYSAAFVKFDASGKALLPALNLGTYYVFSMSRYNDRSIVWNLPVNLKSGQNSVVLDAKNAAWIQR